VDTKNIFRALEFAVYKGRGSYKFYSSFASFSNRENHQNSTHSATKWKSSTWKWSEGNFEENEILARWLGGTALKAPRGVAAQNAGIGVRKRVSWCQTKEGKKTRGKKCVCVLRFTGAAAPDGAGEMQGAWHQINRLLLLQPVFESVYDRHTHPILLSRALNLTPLTHFPDRQKNQPLRTQIPPQND